MLQCVRDPSQVAEARRYAAQRGRELGLTEAALGGVMLVATELATNLLKHGAGGDVLIDRFNDAEGRGLELVAIDSGPGMADVGACLADGYSTAGSSGTGLGAIRRNSDRFAIYSRPGKGTAVKARFIAAPASEAAPAQIGAAALAYDGAPVSGDHWASGTSKAGFTLFMIDGSGHGHEAARAGEVGVEAFAKHLDKDCVALTHMVHQALVRTRGGAIAIARIDSLASTIRFVGVGNVGAAVVSGGQVRRMVSLNGVAGHIAPTIREFTYPYTGQPTLILHSDGLSARWDLDDYPGLAAADCSLMAAILFRDFRRRTDDSLVVAARVVA